LTVDANPAPSANAGGGSFLTAFWSDDAGCRHRLVVQGVGYAGGDFAISAESLSCNDGDLTMVGTPDAGFNVVRGTCLNGGPNCRFEIVRQ
jgi:hypothetical protein